MYMYLTITFIDELSSLLKPNSTVNTRTLVGAYTTHPMIKSNAYLDDQTPQTFKASSTPLPMVASTEQA